MREDTISLYVGGKLCHSSVIPREHPRPLPAAAWEALEKAERLIYSHGGYHGCNGWTDVMCNDGDQMLNLLWNQAEIAYDASFPEDSPERKLCQTAKRVAQALAVIRSF